MYIKQILDLSTLVLVILKISLWGYAMKKLDEIILTAELHKQNWNELDFTNILNILSSSENISISWDNEAGENWASIIKNQVVIAFICRNLPLGFIQDTHFETISTIINNDSFQIEVVKDFDSPNWFIESKDILNLIDWHASKEAVDITKFSINDLTYATM